jgi:hypothetical protein
MTLGARKQFAGAAAAASLVAPIGLNDLSFTVESGQGAPFPDGSTGDFPIDFDRGTSNAERVLCSSRSGDVFTIKGGGRGHDGTTAKTHTTVVGGVTHGVDAETLNDSEAHKYDTSRDDHTQYVPIVGGRVLTADSLEFDTPAGVDMGIHIPQGAGRQSVILGNDGAATQVRVNGASDGTTPDQVTVRAGANIVLTVASDGATFAVPVVLGTNALEIDGDNGGAFSIGSSGNAGRDQLRVGDVLGLTYMQVNHGTDPNAPDRIVLVADGASQLVVDPGEVIVWNGAVLKVQDGTALLPGLSFENDPDTGLYLHSANAMSVAAGGSEAFRFTTIGARALDGSQGSPSYSFMGDTNTGLYLPAADRLGFSAGGAVRAVVSDAGLEMYELGSQGAPSITFENDLDLGLYRYTADILGVSGDMVVRHPTGSTDLRVHSGADDTDAALRFYEHGDVGGLNQRFAMFYDSSLDSMRWLCYDTAGVYAGEMMRTVLSPTNNVQAFFNNSSSLTDPTVTFVGDGDTGMYRYTTNNLGFVAGGTQGMRLGTAAFVPNTDAGLTLGVASLRWGQIYSSVGSISTSDETVKEDVADSPLGLSFIMRLRPIRYRLEGRNRYHDGLSAQNVRKALDAEGVEDAAMFIDPSVAPKKAGKPKKADFRTKVERADGESAEDFKERRQWHRDDDDRAWRLAVEEWEAEKNAPLGLRYEELIAPLINTVQEQQRQIEILQARIGLLENGL